MKNKKRFLFVGVAIGIAILVLAITFKSSPELKQRAEKGKLVDIYILEKQLVAPVVIGYGRATPKNIWKAIAEVSGKLIYKNPLLETGRKLPQGTVLLEIDPLEYQLKLAESQANLNATNAKLSRISQQKINLQSSLLTEEEKFKIARDEYKRQGILKNKRLISNSALENQKQAMLAQKNRVQDLISSLSLIPDDQNITLAQLDINEAQLQNSKRLLAKTKLILPFDAQIASVNIEQDQFINSGSQMLVASKLGAMEVKADLSLKDMNRLMFNTNPSLPEKDEYQINSIEGKDLTAFVSTQNNEKLHLWQAKVTRISEALDPNQATIGIFLDIIPNDKSYREKQIPQLKNGTFLTATIKGSKSEQFVIPEKALHSKSIYIMNAMNRLEIIPVNIIFRTTDGVVISGDLKEGDKLILNDLIPAIKGMSLRTIDEKRISK